MLGTLRERLMQPQLCEEFCREYTQHVNRLRRENNEFVHTRREELQRVETQIAKLVDAIKNGIDPVLIRDEINGLQAHKVTLEASLEDKTKQPVFIHPNMAQRYHAEIQDLIESLKYPDKRDEATDLIRRLIDRIVLTPRASRLSIDLHGDLAGILLMSLDGKQRRRHATSDGRTVAELAELKQIKMVAAAGRTASGWEQVSNIGVMGCSPPQPVPS